MCKKAQCDFVVVQKRSCKVLGEARAESKKCGPEQSEEARLQKQRVGWDGVSKSAFKRSVRKLR